MIQTSKKKKTAGPLNINRSRIWFNTLKRQTSCPFRYSRGDRVLTQKKRNRCACVRCYTQILAARCQPPNVPSIPAHDRLEKTPTQDFLTRRHLCIAHNIAVSPCVAYLYCSSAENCPCVYGVVGVESKWKLGIFGLECLGRRWNIDVLGGTQEFHSTKLTMSRYLRFVFDRFVETNYTNKNDSIWYHLFFAKDLIVVLSALVTFI